MHRWSALPGTSSHTLGVLLSMDVGWCPARVLDVGQCHARVLDAQWVWVGVGVGVGVGVAGCDWVWVPMGNVVWWFVRAHSMYAVGVAPCALMCFMVVQM
jgi:hypothetical protein